MHEATILVWGISGLLAIWYFVKCYTLIYYPNYLNSHADLSFNNLATHQWGNDSCTWQQPLTISLDHIRFIKTVYFSIFSLLPLLYLIIVDDLNYISICTYTCVCVHICIISWQVWRYEGLSSICMHVCHPVWLLLGAIQMDDAKVLLLLSFPIYASIYNKLLCKFIYMFSHISTTVMCSQI